MKIITLLSLMIAATAALPSLLVNEAKALGFIIFDENDQMDQHNHKPHKLMQADKTIAQVIAEDDRFSKFREILDDAEGVRDDLDDEKLRLTVFVPINEAFDKFDHPKQYKTKQIVKYHLTNDIVLGMGDLHDGLVLSSELKEKDLKNERQIIRISRRDNEVYVNLMAHVVSEIGTKNGNILAIDRVLVPPPDMMESIMRVPMVFSTLATAIFRTKMERAFENQKGLTLMAPDNRAWEEHMDAEDLFYLFSEEGKKDLTKILKHHAVKSLEYSSRFRAEGHVTLKTMSSDEIVIDARQTQTHNHNNQHGHHKQRQMVKNCGFPFPCDILTDADTAPEDGVENPEGWEYILNNDQAKIIFADAPTENGVVHMISNVMIPEGIDLPSKRDEL